MQIKTRRAGASIKVRVIVALGYVMLACAALVANAHVGAPAEPARATAGTAPAR